MKKRILTGAVLTIIVGLFVGFSHIPYVINAFSCILSCFCIYEVLRATEVISKNSFYIVPFLLCAIISFAKIPYYIYIISVLFIINIIVFSIMMKKIDTFSLKEKYKSYLFSLYIPFAFKALAEVRLEENGLFLLITTIVVTAFTDIFAHLCGTAFGKTKFIEKISPKKTIEGSLSGVFVTLAVSLILITIHSKCTSISINYLYTTIFLILLSLVGEFGDLSMSTIKRICGIKDYSNILPGHGGILDRFDNLLFTAPYVFIFTSAGSFALN